MPNNLAALAWLGLKRLKKKRSGKDFSVTRLDSVSATAVLYSESSSALSRRSSWKPEGVIYVNNAFTLICPTTFSFTVLCNNIYLSLKTKLIFGFDSTNFHLLQFTPSLSSSTNNSVPSKTSFTKFLNSLQILHGRRTQACSLYQSVILTYFFYRILLNRFVSYA